MRLVILPSEERATTGFNRKMILNAADLAAWTSGTAQACVPQNAVGASSITNPANIIVGRFLTNVITAFTSSGGAITTLSLSFGDGGSATRHVNAVDLKTVGMTLGTTAPYLYTAADTIDAVATIVGQTMASINAGVVEIYFDSTNANDLTVPGQP